MEVAVKYYQLNAVSVTRKAISVEGAARPALCLRGRKNAHCVINDDGTFRVKKIEVREYDLMRGVPHLGKFYDVQACARAFQAQIDRADVRREATQGAREIIRRVLSGGYDKDKVEEFTDVPDVEPSTEVKSTPTDKSTTPRTASAPNLLAKICQEMKIEPTLARRKLRKSGLHAPYDNEAAIRAALGGK